jgi:hypothetical protein
MFLLPFVNNAISMTLPRSLEQIGKAEQWRAKLAQIEDFEE